MNLFFVGRKSILFYTFILICCTSFANVDLLTQARNLQRDGKYDKAINAFKNILQQKKENDLPKQELVMYTEALVQLMNTYQSIGEPEACVITLQEIYKTTPILQKQCLRDYYSVMGYALSRTEKMKEAEETTLKVFTMPLHHATPERYFRDYAYAAAVFYSNPHYQKEVTDWCKEALLQAELCENISGKQWVTAMLGSLYKRNGNISKALELFLQSKEESQRRNDDLGVMNSLHTLIDLFLYWDVPEYANLYASEAIKVEENMSKKNPMISAQAYINKGRALMQLGETDSVSFFTEKAKKLCRALPYNSGMVDIELLNGIYLTEKGGDSLHLGIQELQHVVRQGTITNRAKAYHQLAQTFLKAEKSQMAEIMLDSMCSLLNQNNSPIYININYRTILNHYIKNKNLQKVEQYTKMMLREQQMLKEKKLNYNLVEAIADLQTEQHKKQLEIIRLEQNNQRLWFIISVVLSIIIISIVVAIIFYQKKKHKIQMKLADDNLALLTQKLSQTNAEKEMISQEIDEIINDKDNRQELETLTPSILQKNGESRFRQRFDLLYPLFLPRLREKVPGITRREELLSMLIILKQDNKEIAELLAVSPRSILMLRHRFRQKIGMATDDSLEKFIENMLGSQNNSSKVHTANSNSQESD